MQIAQTIVHQIKQLDRMSFFMWGTDQYVSFDNGLQFNTKGLVKHKGYVKITLNANDLYDIQIFKIRKFEIKVTIQHTDVFVEDLVDLINQSVL